MPSEPVILDRPSLGRVAPSGMPRPHSPTAQAHAFRLMTIQVGYRSGDLFQGIV